MCMSLLAGWCLLVTIRKLLPVLHTLQDNSRQIVLGSTAEAEFLPGMHLSRLVEET